MKLGCLLIFAAALPSLARAQAPAPPAKPDSPEVNALIEKAKEAGGTMWADEAHFLCEAPRGNNANDPVIEDLRQRVRDRQLRHRCVRRSNLGRPADD
jgi:hypothetical protein